jgi:hypothetical protein
MDDITRFYFEEAAQAASFARADYLLPLEDGGNEALMSASLPFLAKTPYQPIAIPPQYVHPKHLYRDCQSAVIRVYRLSEPYRFPIHIEFACVGEGEYFIDDTLLEIRQWIKNPNYIPANPLRARDDEYQGDHEWYAARKHAVKVITSYRKSFGSQIELLQSDDKLIGFYAKGSPKYNLYR